MPGWEESLFPTLGPQKFPHSPKGSSWQCSAQALPEEGGRRVERGEVRRLCQDHNQRGFGSLDVTWKRQAQFHLGLAPCFPAPSLPSQGSWPRVHLALSCLSVKVLLFSPAIPFCSSFPLCIQKPVYNRLHRFHCCPSAESPLSQSQPHSSGPHS